MTIDEPAQQPAYDWVSLIRAYLDNQLTLDDNAEVRTQFHLIDGVLYR
jgi:hypothetical protein